MVEQRVRLSRSVEDYLKAIYALCQRTGNAMTSEIADALDIQPASVTGMIKRLAESGLVEHERYRGVALTPDGELAALRILRRHRILEAFLKERLGYSWDDVHDEAERLEHAASDMLIERMAAQLEDPRHDPHGSPIPTAAGEIEAVDHRTLAETRIGEVVHIRAVRDDDAAQLQEMEDRGLVPGARLRVFSLTEGGGVVVGVAESSEPPSPVEPRMARRIFVTAPGAVAESD